MIVPLLVATALYVLLSFVLLPFYRRYRADISRYSQYAPITSTLQSTTSIFSDHVPEALRPRSIKQKIGNLLLKWLLPSTWAIRRGDAEEGDGRDSEEDDGGLFDEESGERMIGFDMDQSNRTGGQCRGGGRMGIRDSGEANAINAAVGRAQHRDDLSTRRLSRELEEGFMDSDEDDEGEEQVTKGRRRASMATDR